MPRNNTIYQIKVTLRGIKPPIWRRLQVEKTTSLDQVHYIIQISMGWTNSHLHQFIANGSYYGVPDPEYNFDLVDEQKVKLNRVLNRNRKKCYYEYDFGDGWDHELLLEKVIEPESGVRYPRCIKGRRKCPPEDVGGIGGYARFLDIIRDKQHPEHDEYLDWIDGEFDPDEFDADAVNTEFLYIGQWEEIAKDLY